VNSAQANPNKSKRKSVDLLGFTLPNQGLSVGYGESKANFLRVHWHLFGLCLKTAVSFPPALTE
jgi:hypothetical protein